MRLTKITGKNKTNKRGSFTKEKVSSSALQEPREDLFETAGSPRWLIAFLPLVGTPRPGDTIVGQRSGATAQLSRVVFNEREAISELIRYIRTQYPGMKIVTVDQGLDIRGMPSLNR